MTFVWEQSIFENAHPHSLVLVDLKLPDLLVIDVGLLYSVSINGICPVLLPSKFIQFIKVAICIFLKFFFSQELFEQRTMFVLIHFLNLYTECAGPVFINHIGVRRSG